MTPRQFFITIPTQAYIARFLITRYGETIHVSNNTQLGKDLFYFLRYPLGCGLSTEKKELLSSLLNAQIKLRIPVKWKNKLVLDPSLDHIIVINRYLKNYFNVQLNIFCSQYINSHRRRYAGYKIAIETFARMNNISLEEDITFEALKKSEYRFRKKF